ncbi:hypothetical protein ACP275_03G022300 [Erythranthe tilingii]
MNSIVLAFLPVLLLFSTTNNNFCSATPRLLALVKPDPIVLKYHNGKLLKGNVTVNLIWYGKFTSPQKSILVDFLQSLSPRRPLAPPSVASWWSTTATYKGGPSNILLGKQVVDEKYSLGKSLKDAHITALASMAGLGPTAVNVVLTSADVAVEDFCMNTCGTHGYTSGKKPDDKYALAWVGNSGKQCPGQCAWPFYKPVVGPQTPPLVAPNGDVGIDGMVINLATVLAGTVTNPFDGGYYQGADSTAGLEAVTACLGIFGSGAFPGYPGKVVVDKTSGASYNAQGANGRRYLLPAMWDPATSTCKTLV